MKPTSKHPIQADQISVIVSVYNFADSVEALYRAILDALKGLGRPVEIAFVDDGSTDGTFETLSALARQDQRLKAIQMRSTFGEAAALEAGLDYTCGGTVVFLTGRVRVNPAEIPRFIQRMEAEDLVAGWRYPRHDGLLNRFISFIFNRIAGRISHVKLHDINSGIIVTRREVLERISFYGDLYNFIPLLAGKQGYRVGEEKIAQLPGSFRKSKYAKEYIQRLLDIVTVFFLSRYSKKPIHFLGFVGSLFVISGLGVELYLFVSRILQIRGIAGSPLLILGALLLVIGIQMISIGLLGEMINFTHAGDIEEYNIKEIVE